jgi:hypothetical protein
VWYWQTLAWEGLRKCMKNFKDEGYYLHPAILG